MGHISFLLFVTLSERLEDREKYLEHNLRKKKRVWKGTALSRTGFGFVLFCFQGSSVWGCIEFEM